MLESPVIMLQCPQSALFGELVPNGNLEYDNRVLDFVWIWAGFMEADPLMNVLRAPRFNCNIEDHALEVKRAFCAGLYMNLMPRKPDRPNGTALLSDKPELSAALKEVAPLRRKFLHYFTEGVTLGDSVLSEPSAGFVRAYQLGQKLLVIVLNEQPEARDMTLASDLAWWLSVPDNWVETAYDGQGRKTATRPGSTSHWQKIIHLESLEMAFFEITSAESSR